ncbi:MAG: NAD(P)-dependent oxidoreductase [Chloroflexota bacterium]
MSLRGKVAFVTGGSGFLGGALVHRLVAEGMRVRALVRHSSDSSYINGLSGVETIIGDITHKRSVFTASKDCAYVFHVAAALGGHIDYQKQVNVEGTRIVAEAAASVGSERMIHVSSIAVYGYGVDGKITEDTAHTDTLDPYAQTKAEAEKRLHMIAEKRWLSYSIIRPGMIYGPRSGAWTAKMFNMAKRSPTIFAGDGSGHAHPIHVDDVVDMIVTLATHPAAEGQAFNCAPDPAPTWREFLGHYSALAGHSNWLGVPAPLATLGLDVRAYLAEKGSPDVSWGEKARYIQRDVTYSMAKARDLLEWQPSVPLAEGIANTAPWLREQGLLTS